MGKRRTMVSRYGATSRKAHKRGPKPKLSSEVPFLKPGRRYRRKSTIEYTGFFKFLMQLIVLIVQVSMFIIFIYIFINIFWLS
ncbi:hypothetical protein [Jeotgalibaca dankookensis]|uniref:hypothetical protein n=1 Tax=Jeotgalibaca dankookensis TaxID=708126 RepID=UPI00078372CF|nr:hypothetical protein [Jeotgalibaca dankookensis]